MVARVAALDEAKNVVTTASQISTLHFRARSTNDANQGKIGNDIESRSIGSQVQLGPLSEK